ncbi:MAG TPA: hypothetical protein VFI91_07395 [Longimicrobiaceae bacterium]|nr:hypothetical protein [Longimicrobiaceae bacterium]
MIDQLRAGPRDNEELSLSRAIKLCARGITLHCPHCGKGRLLDTWFKLKLKCPNCGLRSDRGEEDIFLGGMMWNIVFSEGLLLMAGVAIGIATWPDVPWMLMQWVGVALMVLAPFFFYPFSLGFWLACDILIRPVTEAEMNWHRQSKEGEFRHYRDR